MKRILRWLMPNTFLSGLVFGYLFGVAFGVTLMSVAMLRDAHPPSVVERYADSFHLVFTIGIPWVLIWSGSGAACGQIPGHPGTTATLFAIACATAYTLHNHTYGAWTPFEIMLYTFLAVIPCHMLWYCIAALFGRIRDPEEAE